ncbi:MAG: MerR family transcriptional regulator [Lachnospiraceae bacterium]|nr:MerR family transcriptional regulator [Lachnospiraceae bacterium]
MDFNDVYFTVGQFAEFNHVPAQTLRYYDQIGLLKPSHYNEQTGYRYYSITQCATMDIISHMKSLKYSLKDIKWYLETNDQDWLVSSLVEKQKSIEQDIDHLNKLNAVIKRKLRDYHTYANYPMPGTTFIEVIPQRHIFKYDTGINYYYNENDSANYEYMLRVFKRKLAEHKIPDEYYFNVSSIMSKASLLSGQFRTTELFVFISDNDHDLFPYTETIPPNIYFCMICDDSKNETACIHEMIRQITERGCTIIGPYICEVVSEFLSAVCDERQMILKLQIPITFNSYVESGSST